LNLDFDRFEFPGSDGGAEVDEVPAPGMGRDPQQGAAVPCSRGSRECLDEGAPMDVVLDPMSGVGAGPGRDAGGAAGGADAVDLADAAAPGPRTCGECTGEENCVLGLCQPAASSCGALAELDPNLGDGLYAIAPQGIAHRTYCDMTARLALCSDEQGEHEGVTRGSPQLRFVLTSVLQGSECRVWNVRAVADGYPLDGLVTSESDRAVRPCTPLGFVSDPPGYDVDAAGCRYGVNGGFDTCGFNVTRPLYKWSNLCECQRPVDMNPGYHAGYVLQGEIFASVIPWNASGSISVLCGT
jgi:hypothetical protein